MSKDNKTLPPPAVRRFLRDTAKPRLGLKAAAKIIGCNQASLSRYESGHQNPKRPDIVHRYRLFLESLAEAAGTTLESVESMIAGWTAGTE